MNLRWISVLAAALLLAACGPVGSPSPAPIVTQTQSAAQPAAPTGLAPTPTPDRPLAAMVNGQPIYLADYERQVAQYQMAKIASGTDPNSPEWQQQLLQMREQVLNWMIEQVLIEQAAAGMGIVVSDEEVDAALAQIIEEVGGEEAFQARLEQDGMTRQEAWEELRAQLITSAAIEQIVATVPTTAEHVHARHILVDTREEAEQLLAQLQSGADFAELARAYSKDESTREAGGDLGFFPRGVLLAPEVEEAAFSLQAGQISPVIQSSLGFHIVQVIEREERSLSPENLQLLRNKAIQEWIETLWAQATIERYVDLSP